MENSAGGEGIVLSDDERMFALTALSNQYIAGRINYSEFYSRSADAASARTLPCMHRAFQDLSGGTPLEVVGGSIRKRRASPDDQASGGVVFSHRAEELRGLRERGSLIEYLDWAIVGSTLVIFLTLQFVVGWSHAWVVLLTVLVTLSIPRVALKFSEAEENVYEDIKEIEMRARRRRRRQAAERIRNLRNLGEMHSE